MWFDEEGRGNGVEERDGDCDCDCDCDMEGTWRGRVAEVCEAAEVMGVMGKVCEVEGWGAGAAGEVG